MEKVNKRTPAMHWGIFLTKYASMAPLILHSSFVFEAMISHLKRQFHGTRGIIAQIVRNMLMAQNSGSFIKDNTREPSIISTFVDERIIGKRDKGLLKVENYSFIPPLKKNPDLPRHLALDEKMDLPG